MLEIAHTGFTERLLIGLAALVLNCVLCGPLSFYQKLNLSHPVMFLHWIILKLERKLNREKRSVQERRLRGVLLVALMLSASVALAFSVSNITFAHLFPLSDILLVCLLLSARPLFDHTRYILDALRQKNLEEAQQLVQPMLRKNSTPADEYTIARVAIERLAEGFSTRVLAPLFWYLLLGLPGLFACNLLHIMSALIGHRNGKHAAFGAAALLGYDLINLVPARITGIYFLLAAFFVPGCRPFQAMHIVWRDADKLHSPNSGWPIAAAAGALHLSLAGPKASAEGAPKEKWVGIGTAKATTTHVKHALLLYAMSLLLLVLSIAALSYI